MNRLSLAIAFLAIGVCVVGAEPPSTSADAEKLLQAAQLPTDGPGLLKFFQQRTLSESDRLALVNSVEKLGADAFEEREQASEDLTRAGLAAMPLLRDALRHSDVEVARRAERILETVTKDYDANRLHAAARILLERNPPGALEKLLDYLPTIRDDETLFEGVLQLITTKTADAGPVDAKLLANLSAREPLQRVIAARILLSARPEQRNQIRKLADDADPMVRYTTASELLMAGDKTVMPTLLALLTDGPMEYAYRTEDLLCRLLMDETPAQTLQGAEGHKRQVCRDSWTKWWANHSETIDLTRLRDGEPLRGLTIVVEVDNNGGFNSNSGRIWECGPDGKQRWEMTDVGGPVDVQVLSGGRFLLAEYYTRRITERDRTGKILWDSGALPNSPVSCQRLTNGNTLIATMQEVLEMTPDKKRVGTYPRAGGTVYHARRGKNGHTYYMANGQIHELDTTGKPIKAIAVGNTSGWGGFELLPNGHFLVSFYVASNRVVELDADGKEVWSVPTNSPTRAQRLRNGNTLVAGGNQAFIYEYDRKKAEVWKVPTRGRPFSVLRY